MATLVDDRVTSGRTEAYHLSNSFTVSRGIEGCTTTEKERGGGECCHERVEM